MRAIEKLRAAQQRSLLCIGLDPDYDRLPNRTPSDTIPQTLLDFCEAIVRATHDLVSAYKPNLAYFLHHGAEGVETLRQLISRIASIASHTPVILDAKFGDIGHTASHYAHFAFEYLKADAVTLSPYIGTDALRPFLAYADKLCFVLCRTSNLDGNEFQPSGAPPLFQQVATHMAALALDYPQQIGLVVGATQTADLSTIRALAPNLPFLVPGIGTQGGDMAAVLQHGATQDGIGAVINVGREVLYASVGSDYAETARAKVNALRERLNAGGG